MVAPLAKSAAGKANVSLIPHKKARTAKKESANLAFALPVVLLMAVVRAQTVVLPGNATLTLPRLPGAAVCASHAPMGNVLLIIRKNATVASARMVRAFKRVPMQRGNVTPAKNAMPTGHAQPMIPRRVLAEFAKEELANVVMERRVPSPMFVTALERACWAALS
jgi:hypothetical protein